MPDETKQSSVRLEAVGGRTTFAVNSDSFRVHRKGDSVELTIWSISNEKIVGLELSKEDMAELGRAAFRAIREVAITWCVADVFAVAKEYDHGHLINERAAMDILEDFVENHDCNYGVSWDELHEEVDNWISNLLEDIPNDRF